MQTEYDVASRKYTLGLLTAEPFVRRLHLGSAPLYSGIPQH